MCGQGTGGEEGVGFQVGGGDGGGDLITSVQFVFLPVKDIILGVALHFLPSESH